MDQQDQESGCQPYRCISHSRDICSGSDHRNDNVKNDIGNLFRSLNLSKRSHRCDQAGSCYEKDRPGCLIKNRQNGSNHNTGILGQRGYKKGYTDQKKHVFPCKRSLVLPCLFFQRCSYFIDQTYICLCPGVEFLREINHPQKEHNIDHCTNRVHYQGICQTFFTYIQNCLNRQHITAAA